MLTFEVDIVLAFSVFAAFKIQKYLLTFSDVNESFTLSEKKERKKERKKEKQKESERERENERERERKKERKREREREREREIKNKYWF